MKHSSVFPASLVTGTQSSRKRPYTFFSWRRGWGLFNDSMAYSFLHVDRSWSPHQRYNLGSGAETSAINRHTNLFTSLWTSLRPMDICVSSEMSSVKVSTPHGEDVTWSWTLDGRGRKTAEDRQIAYRLHGPLNYRPVSCAVSPSQGHAIKLTVGNPAVILPGLDRRWIHPAGSRRETQLCFWTG